MKTNFIYSLNEESYLVDVNILIKTLLSSMEKVCYISLNKSAESIKESLKKNNIPDSNIVIVDMISSRFKKPSPKERVYYFDITNEKNTTKFIVEVIEKEKCEGVIIDSLSTMNIYYQEKELQKFVHDLIVYSESNRVITNMIIQKKDEKERWVEGIVPLVGKIKNIKF